MNRHTPQRPGKERKYRNMAVCDAYRAGDSAQTLARVFGVTDVMILWILRKYGVERRPQPAMRRRV